MGTAIKHPVPDRVKPSFVIFDIRVTRRWASECPDVNNYKWWLNPVWHGMLCGCTHMATVGVKGLIEYNEISNSTNNNHHDTDRYLCTQKYRQMSSIINSQQIWVYSQAPLHLVWHCYDLSGTIINYDAWFCTCLAQSLLPMVATSMQSVAVCFYRL